jgi:hypothetical protein
MAFDLTSNEQSRAAPQMTYAVYLFLSAFAAASRDLRGQRPEKRRFFGAEALRVRGDDPEADIASKFIRDAEADLAASERRLGYGPSLWESLERLPTQHEDRRHLSLYRAFLRLIAADFSWFATAAEQFYAAGEAALGPQVVTGVEEIATETRRTPAGVLRLVKGGKLPVASVNGKPVSTTAVLRRHRRYGETAIAA